MGAVCSGGSKSEGQKSELSSRSSTLRDGNSTLRDKLAMGPKPSKRVRRQRTSSALTSGQIKQTKTRPVQHRKGQQDKPTSFYPQPMTPTGHATPDAGSNHGHVAGAPHIILPNQPAPGLDPNGKHHHHGDNGSSAAPQPDPTTATAPPTDPAPAAPAPVTQPDLTPAEVQAQPDVTPSYAPAPSSYEAPASSSHTYDAPSSSFDAPSSSGADGGGS